MHSNPTLDWRNELQDGTLTSQALTKRVLNRIEQLEPSLNATIYHDPQLSLSLAQKADERLMRGERTAILGLPFTIKDNFNLLGTPMTCGSKILVGYQSPYTATVVDRLILAGGIPIAKTNMDEFAMGSSGEFSAFGPARNPWNLSRVTGGSSSGSVASVSASYATFSLGSDTGGSVRLPGSFCGTTAMRPTYGTLSRFGLTAMASSLDVVGPIAQSAFELAAAFAVMAGSDPKDSTSVDVPKAADLYPLKPYPLQGLTIGLPKEYFSEGIHPEVREVINACVRDFEKEGAIIKEISLPHTSYAIDTYYLICVSELSSNLARFDGVRFGLRSKDQDSLTAMISATRDEGLGPEAKRRILLGAFSLSRGHIDEYYHQALKVRSLIIKDFAKAFQEVDILLTPVCPNVAFPFGEKSTDPMSMYLSDIYAAAPSLANLPCISVPAGLTYKGKTQDSMPVGAQLIGPQFSDVKLLQVAHAYQMASQHHLSQPNI